MGRIPAVAAAAAMLGLENVKFYLLIFKNMIPMKTNLFCCWRRASLAGLGLGLVLPLGLFAADEQSFDSPNDAVHALVTAAQNNDTNAFHLIFGPVAHELVSPDVVQATEEFKKFVQRLSEKTELFKHSDSNVVLELGADGWPFPIPLVLQGAQWRFDTAAGKAEILARRVGRDEMGAINVCRAYVEAQREYASQDRMVDGVLTYARFLRSTTGTHDGLFWPADQPGDLELSPLGPLIAQARVEGYHHTAKMLNDEQAPYHGYYFKILTCQGKHAPGGKFSYVINGRMLVGFALVAWPAEWGNTGLMTFVVNQQGKLWQKNLGPKSARLAKAMTVYDPDATWAAAE